MSEFKSDLRQRLDARRDARLAKEAESQSDLKKNLDARRDARLAKGNETNKATVTPPSTSVSTGSEFNEARALREDKYATKNDKATAEPAKVTAFDAVKNPPVQTPSQFNPVKAEREDKYASATIKGAPVSENKPAYEAKPATVVDDSRKIENKAQREDKYATENIKGDNSELFDKLYPDASDMQRRDYNFKRVYGENGEKLDALPDTPGNRALKLAAKYMVPSQMDVPELITAVERSDDDKNTAYLNKVKADKFYPYAQGLSYEELEEEIKNKGKKYTNKEVKILNNEKYYRDYEIPFMLLDKEVQEKVISTGQYAMAETANNTAMAMAGAFADTSAIASSATQTAHNAKKQDEMRQELIDLGYTAKQASEFLKIGERIYNDRLTTKKQENIKNASGLELAGYNILSWFEPAVAWIGMTDLNSQNLSNKIGPYRPVDYKTINLLGTNMARTTTKTTADRINNPVGNFFYDAANMIADIGVASLYGPAANFFLSSSGALNETLSAHEAGASDVDAINYGNMVFASTYITESMFGGIGGFGTGFLDDIGASIFKGLRNPILRGGLKAIGTIGGEVVEEEIQYLLEVGAQKITYDPNATVNLGEMTYTGLLSAVVSLPGGTFKGIQGAKEAKMTKATYDTVQSIIDTANKATTPTEARQAMLFMDTTVKYANKVMSDYKKYPISTFAKMYGVSEEGAKALYNDAELMASLLTDAETVYAKEQYNIIYDNADGTIASEREKAAMFNIATLVRTGNKTAAMDAIAAEISSNEQAMDVIAALGSMPDEEKAKMITLLTERNNAWKSVSAIVENDGADGITGLLEANYGEDGIKYAQAEPKTPDNSAVSASNSTSASTGSEFNEGKAAREDARASDSERGADKPVVNTPATAPASQFNPTKAEREDARATKDIRGTDNVVKDVVDNTSTDANKDLQNGTGSGESDVNTDENVVTPTSDGKKGDTLDDSNIVLEQDENKYPYNEQKVIDGYEDAVDNGVINYINKIRTMNNPDVINKQKYEVADVSDRFKNDVRNLTNTDFDGEKYILRGGNVKHIDSRHGINGEADHSMANDNDFARIGWVLENYDTIELVYDKNGNPAYDTENKNSDNTPSPIVKVSKKINGTYFVVEAVPVSSANSAFIKSAYISKNGIGEESDGVLNMSDQDPQLTSTPPHRNNDTVSRDDSSRWTDTDTNISITQAGENVNTQIVEEAPKTASVSSTTADTQMANTDNAIELTASVVPDESMSVSELRDKLASGETYGKFTKTMADAFYKIAKAFGVDIIIDRADGGLGYDGYFDKANRAIHVNADAVKPLDIVLRHEVIHFFKSVSPLDFEVFAGLIKERYISLYGEEAYNKYVLDKREEYKARTGEEISEETALEELCADEGMDMLARPDDVRKFVTKNRNVFKRFFDCIKRVLQRLGRALGIRGIESYSVSEAYTALSKAANGPAVSMDTRGRMVRNYSDVTFADAERGVRSTLPNEFDLTSFEAASRMLGIALDSIRDAERASYSALRSIREKDIGVAEKKAEYESVFDDNLKAEMDKRGAGEDTVDDNDFVYSFSGDASRDFRISFVGWINDGRPDRKVITVGTTSEALKSIGVKDQVITWDTSKINKIQRDHPGMSDRVFMQVPNILEKPIIVMQSRSVDSRVTIFGSLVDDNNKPVLAVLELLPNDKYSRDIVLDEIKVVNAYGKDSPYDLILNSEILYLDPNKKRTDNWLMRNRLQLPFGITNYGPIRSITYPEGNVNTQFMQNSEINSSSDDTIQNKYSFSNDYIPKGEKPARDIAVPAHDDKGRPVSRGIRTILEAEATPETYVSGVLREIREGNFSRQVITDKAALKRATDTMSKRSYISVFEELVGMSERGKMLDKYDIALLQTLYNESGEHIEFLTQSDSSGVTNIDKLLSALVNTGRVAGQNLQAQRMLKLMTPMGLLYNTKSLVDDINARITEELGEFVSDTNKRIVDDVKKKGRKKYNPKQKPIVINAELQKQLLDAKTLEDAQRINDAILADLGDQVLGTWIDKVRKLRYFGMLSGPRTHVRNMAGNSLNKVQISMADSVSAMLQRLFIKDPQKRTKALVGIKRKNHERYKALRAYARELFGTYADYVKGDSNRYDMQTYANDAFENARHAFNSKLGRMFEKIVDFNSDMLEREDMLFLKPAFEKAFAKVAFARGYTVSDLTSGKVSAEEIKTMIDIASKAAQEATFREASWIATKLNEIEKKNAFTELAVGTIIPFKKTPVNILKTGTRYSPAGLILFCGKVVGQTYDRIRGKRTSFDGVDLIDTASKGLVGTGVFLIGAFLGSLGLLIGGEDEDDKLEALEDAQGHQNYALEIGNFSITLDWMTPVNMPLFAGVAFNKAVEDGGLEFDDIVPVLSDTINPVLEASLLSGTFDTIRAIRTAESDSDIVTAFIEHITASYGLSFFPQLIAAAAKTIDSVDSRTTADAGMSEFERFWRRQVANKLPFLRDINKPYTDRWGGYDKKDSPLDYIGSFLQNFVIPGYVSQISDTNTTAHLSDLYEKTGSTDFIPTYVKSFSVNKQTKKLTQDEIYEYQIRRGELWESTITELMQDDIYMGLSSDKQAYIMCELCELIEVICKYECDKRYNVSKKKHRAVIDEGSTTDVIIDYLWGTLDDYQPNLFERYPVVGNARNVTAAGKRRFFDE